MMRFLSCLVLLALLGCEADTTLVSPSDVISEDVAAKGNDRWLYDDPDDPYLQYGIGELYVDCLDETVDIQGFAVLVGFGQITPSGNYIDYIRFDFDTIDPMRMVYDGETWPLLAGEDNSLYMSRPNGKKAGLLTVQANLIFVSPDGKSRVHYRAHYLAEGMDWTTGELIGVRKRDDVFKCHLKSD